ncbi:antitoxin VapB family protein [Natronococcus wangiae]|uniref:antitoxin VapB family protein n=1 Tax=Natronococcus wangiae TaxID=3068275 RepID=UPI00273E5FFC|nr:antitoxin VapB family protein [Natronococcus sp. AD5]
MGTKTISIKDDAYDRLRRHKRGDESFSDVVMRLTRREKDPMEAAGKFPGLGDERDEFRKRFDRDLRERRDLRQ